jgi:hypothetical protein
MIDLRLLSLMCRYMVLILYVKFLMATFCKFLYGRVDKMLNSGSVYHLYYLVKWLVPHSFVFFVLIIHN